MDAYYQEDHVYSSKKLMMNVGGQWTVMLKFPIHPAQPTRVRLKRKGRGALYIFKDIIWRQRSPYYSLSVGNGNVHSDMHSWALRLSMTFGEYVVPWALTYHISISLLSSSCKSRRPFAPCLDIIIHLLSLSRNNHICLIERLLVEMQAILFLYRLIRMWWQWKRV